jgi:DNA-binding transcriptional LysR family regulator
LDSRADQLKLLAALDALLDQANVTRAARELGVSQPALSAQLARLRELFGDPLLVPAQGGRGMVATARAVAMRGPLRAALTQLRDLFDPPPPFRPEHSDRTFAIALNDNAATMLCGPLVAAVQEAGAERVRLSFLQCGSSIAAALESGELDLAIGSPLNADEGLICRQLLSDSYQTACRPGLLAGPLDLETYCRLPHVMVSAVGGGFASSVDEALARLGRKRRVAVSVQSYAVAPTVVAQSDCLCTLPRRFLARCGDQLQIFDPPFDLANFSLSALWHARAADDPAHVWLRERLFAAAAPRSSAIG